MKFVAPTSDIHCRVYTEDLIKARNLGINTSELLREYLHNYVNSPTNDSLPINEIESDIEKTKSQLAEAVASLRHKESLLNQAKKKAEAEEQQRKQQAEAERLARTTCAICARVLRSDVIRTSIIAGPHQGKFSCGGYGTGCTAELLRENRSWIIGRRVNETKIEVN